MEYNWIQWDKLFFTVDNENSMKQVTKWGKISGLRPFRGLGAWHTHPREPCLCLPYFDALTSWNLADVAKTAPSRGASSWGQQVISLQVPLPYANWLTKPIPQHQCQVPHGWGQPPSATDKPTPSLDSLLPLLPTLGRTWLPQVALHDILLHDSHFYAWFHQNLSTLTTIPVLEILHITAVLVS